MSVQLLDPLLPPVPTFGEESPSPGNAGTGGFPALPPFDSVGSQYPMPPPAPSSMPFGPLGGILQYLSSLISQLLGNFGNTNASGQPFFQNASGGSCGDPHLSFNGSTWNNMSPQPDLLDSNSICGGYRVSTQTTPPDANGVTYNQSATVHTNFGQSAVTLDNAGNATVWHDGFSCALSDGESMNVGNGTTATRNADGSVTVSSAAQNGGSLTTTMTQNGPGVDVNISGNNVDLGGALVSGAPARLQPVRYGLP